eukprot:2732779-Ditylum_brightwellii.AAC.1
MYWWLIWWIWDGKTATIATKQEVPIRLDVSFREETTTRTIKRINCDDPLKELGLLINPAGDFAQNMNSERSQSYALPTEQKKHPFPQRMHIDFIRIYGYPLRSIHWQ